MAETAGLRLSMYKILALQTGEEVFIVAASLERAVNVFRDRYSKEKEILSVSRVCGVNYVEVYAPQQGAPYR